MVASVLRDHPDWLGVTNKAIQLGVTTRLDDEVQKRADAETALAIAFDHSKNIPKNQIDLVRRAIINSKMFGGTKYAKDLEVLLTKPNPSGKV